MPESPLPPPLPRNLPPLVPPPPLVEPPIISTHRSQGKPLQRSAKLWLIGGCVLAGLALGFILLRAYQFVRWVGQPHPPTPSSYFYSATGQIGPLGQSVCGNSAEAVDLAKKMAATMTAIRIKHFTQLDRKALLDQSDTFKVYCDLRPNQCVFLIHVAELRRFEGGAQQTLGGYAWNAAQGLLQGGQALQQPARVAVGLRGAIMYERMMTGTYSPGAGDTSLSVPEVAEGFGCEQRVVPWLAPLETNSFSR